MLTICLKYLSSKRSWLGSKEVTGINSTLQFDDYAVANWHKHLDNFVTNAEESLKLDKYDLYRLQSSLKLFMSRYPEEDWRNVPECEFRCQVFRGHRIYKNLVAVLSCVYSAQSKGLKNPNKITFEAIARDLSRTRKFLENPPASLSSKEAAYIQETYFGGKKGFKCPLVNCEHFYKGFENSQERNLHSEKHHGHLACDVPFCRDPGEFPNERHLNL